MAAAQVIAVRFVDLVDQGQYHEVEGFLDDNIVVCTWNGVVYGKEKAMTFFEDFRRYSHHKHNFNRWRQVHHSLDPSLRMMNEQLRDVLPEDRLELRGRLMTGRMRGGDPEVEKYFDGAGYDSQGFAMFERDGKFGSHPKVAFMNLPIRQVLVLRHGKVVLFQVDMRR